MKKHFFISMTIYLLAANAYAEAVTPVAGSEAAVPSQPTLQEKIAKIQVLEGEANFTEAQNAYQALLNDASISVTDKDALKESLYKINMKILFSKIEMSESEMYTVVSGDSLYKIAKKYNTTIELIKKSNNLSKDTIFPNQKLKVIKGTFSVKIDISETRLDLLLNNNIVKSYQVATGKRDSETPEGQFKIVTKLPNPTWYRAGAVVAPDSPENILGTRWMGFDLEGYGIHGTTQPETIGQAASAGCIRMLNTEVEELYSIIPRGTRVSVVQ